MPVPQKEIAVLRLPEIVFVTAKVRYSKLWYLVIFLYNKVWKINLEGPCRSLLLHELRYWVEIYMKLLAGGAGRAYPNVAVITVGRFQLSLLCGSVI